MLTSGAVPLRPLSGLTLRVPPWSKCRRRESWCTARVQSVKKKETMAIKIKKNRIVKRSWGWCAPHLGWRITPNVFSKLKPTSLSHCHFLEDFRNNDNRLLMQYKNNGYYRPIVNWQLTNCFEVDFLLFEKRDHALEQISFLFPFFKSLLVDEGGTLLS